MLFFIVGMLIASVVLGWLFNAPAHNPYLDAIHVLFPLIVLAVCVRLLLQGYPYYAAGLFVLYGVIFTVSTVLRVRKRRELNRSWK